VTGRKREAARPSLTCLQLVPEVVWQSYGATSCDIVWTEFFRK
jgi:hypothetical protein